MSVNLTRVYLYYINPPVCIEFMGKMLRQTFIKYPS